MTIETILNLPKILSVVRTVQLPAQSMVLTTEKYFGEAGTVLLGKNFRHQFLNRVVHAVGKVELAVHRLEKCSFDTPIIFELGSRFMILASQLRAFLAVNRESREWFVFYLRGRNGGPWAVSAHWYVNAGDGWSIQARSVENAAGSWNTGYQIVSRSL